MLHSGLDNTTYISPKHQAKATTAGLFLYFDKE